MIEKTNAVHYFLNAFKLDRNKMYIIKCDRNVHKEFLCQKLPIFRILSRSKPFIESAKCLSILNILIYLVYRLNTSREERERDI